MDGRASGRVDGDRLIESKIRAVQRKEANVFLDTEKAEFNLHLR